MSLFKRTTEIVEQLKLQNVINISKPNDVRAPSVEVIFKTRTRHTLLWLSTLNNRRDNERLGAMEHPTPSPWIIHNSLARYSARLPPVSVN